MELTPYGFATREEILASLGLLEGAQEPRLVELAIRSANDAVSWLETETARALGRRTFRATTTIVCGTTKDGTAVTGAGFNALKVLDDVVGTPMQPWTRIASITNDAALTLERPAAATSAAASLTFGSAAAFVDGEGSSEIYAPEFPLSAVYAAAALDDAGVATALNLTGMRIDRLTGLIILPNDTFPEGRRNIRLEFKAGYARPSAVELGDAEASLLQKMQLRMTQCFYDDQEKHPGRGETRTVGPLTTSIRFKVPEDVRDNLPKFVRR